MNAFENNIYNCIRSVAIKEPNNIAICYKHLQYTYSETVVSINKVVQYLSNAGFKKGNKAIILLDRCPETIFSIFAILQLGGIYVPIDPTYPRERIDFIANDTAASFIIQSSSTPEVSNISAKKIIIEEALIAAAVTDSIPDTEILPDDPAYIIYTSGSTGKPKGATVSHKNILHFLNGMQDVFHITEKDNFLSVSSTSFDASCFDYYLSLTNGATLVLADTEAVKSGTALLQLFQQQKITISLATPVTFKLMLESGWEEPLNTKILSAGEPLPYTLAAELLPKCSALYNVYGPTETTVICILTQITTAEDITIGKPIIGTPIYFLNEKQEPVAEGEPGEIYIGGDGVSLGYINRPELTKEKFLKDPFSQSADARMYKSGDIGLQRVDGHIVYMGRTDNQVKIRGFRIELGEIEYQLSKLDGIKEAVVLIKENKLQDKIIVAYIKPTVTAIEQARAIAEWKKSLSATLPVFMIPDRFVFLEQFPISPNGKIDRNAFPEPSTQRPQLQVLYKKPKTNIENNIATIWSLVLEIDEIGVDDNFFELGGNSLLAQQFVTLAGKKNGYQIPVTKLYQYPTIAALQQFLHHHKEKKPRKSTSPMMPNANGDVAIIGMECKFPGAETIEQFWENLLTGKETVTFFTDEDLDSSLSHAEKENPDYVKARGILNNTDLFDADFFGIHPKLAELMDPQQRFFLELSRNVLEKTGYINKVNEYTIGVFAGCNTNTYFNNNVIWHKDKLDIQGLFPVTSVTDKDYIATRVAYQLNLNGPAVNVNSACSTSLLAVAQAVDNIRTGKCNMAIAGGAAIHVPIHTGHLYEEGTMLSADGHTRTFDAEAKGTIFSDGVGAVLLKSLQEAQKDGDTIYAIIKGVGVNNDGGDKGSFSAPSTEGQYGAIHMAIKDAHVNPANISYVEAHGTATPLGDPIEIEGLKMAFGNQDQKQYCALGSVKTNMGHLTHAAGVAGLIKTALSLYYKKLPPSLHFNNANPELGIEDSPFYINSQLQNWESKDKRIAGVSSFGVGGTNVHVIIEENSIRKNEDETPAADNEAPYIIPWSAKNKESTALFAQSLLDFVTNNKNIPIEQISYTLQTTRQELQVRNAVVANNHEDLIEKLTAEIPKTTPISVAEADPHLVFMFPGQGSQYINMGKQLYNSNLVYKAAVDECAAILLEEIGEDIREIIFTEENELSTEKLKNTYYTQPAIFITSYALGKLLLSYGIQPTALVGHSIGEFVAAYFAGIFSLKDVIKIVANRARLISNLPGGVMLSVRSSVNTVEPCLMGDVSVAAINAPQLCVLSGSEDSIDTISDNLSVQNIVNKKLKTSHAFHSSHMDSIVQPLQQIIETFKLNIPRIPLLSTVTGNWLKDEEAADPSYWALHSRKTVRFSTAIQELENEFHPIFLEIGPGTVTSVLAKQHGGAVSQRSFATMHADHDECLSLKTSIAELWKRGIKINWALIFPTISQKILHHLPTYAYNKKRFWLLPPNQPASIFPIEQNILNNTYTFETHANTKEPDVMNRKETLIKKIIDIVEATSGIDLADAAPDLTFTELGLDSLLITQIASGFKKEFNTPVTFRQLNEEYDTLNKLAAHLDEQLPKEVFSQNTNTAPVAQNIPIGIPVNNVQNGQTQNPALSLIAQQLNLLTQQVALLQGVPSSQLISTPTAIHTNNNTPPADSDITEQEKIEIKKPFGATARIEKTISDISQEQRNYLNNLIEHYNNKTRKSKEYTQQHRSYMADPRVVSGFKPLTKEMVYSIVINKSKGCYLWDIDDNKYIDALNGFGSNFLGYQADVLKEAILEQVEKGYEIGPQHELAGEVCKMICEMTGTERSALCNTGSEAVLGAMRIARTVTGKNTIVAFTGSYHGINDEVLVRGTKKLKTFAAAPGILQSNVQNMLILDYGEPESLKIIKEKIDDIAAVLVDPVQSRRPEFVPIEFLQQLREITINNNTALIFDEVITGFRSHPGGVQALFNIKADLATYGKVVGGGLSIGVIAGSTKYMDALDGGYWQYGDGSIPEVGVTYFAGTFVRHPLALATAKATLSYLKKEGNALQEKLNDSTAALAQKLNNICTEYQIPLYIAHFSSLWKIKIKEEYPYQELLFSLMRLKNIHIWDGFPCFITASHTQEDIDKIADAFKESIEELSSIGFIPQKHTSTNADTLKIYTNQEPPVPGARLGKDEEGNPAWFVSDTQTGNYIKINMNNL
ncbi:MAG: amino acid adenylation domain-containing protein [Niabella sp.]